MRVTTNKWRFAIGTTSIVPNTDPLRQYLIVDVDVKNVQPTLNYLTGPLGIESVALYPTPHGWHVYTPLIMRWGMLLWTLKKVPGVDPNWLRIGTKRGYFYLADKTATDLDWPVVRMVLNRKRKDVK